MIKISKQHEKNEMRKIQMTEKQEFWDIYNEKKERTGRTMKRNDWCLKDGEYHIREETGLDVAEWDGGYLFTYRRDNPGEGDNYFVDVYRFSADFDESDIKLQEEETDGYLFASAEEIKKLGEEGKFLHYDSIRQAFV